MTPARRGPRAKAGGDPCREARAVSRCEEDFQRLSTRVWMRNRDALTSSTSVDTGDLTVVLKCYFLRWGKSNAPLLGSAILKAGTYKDRLSDRGCARR